jgi:hypothetical protein
MKRFILFFVALVAFSAAANAQVAADLTIENQVVSNDTAFFDIVVTRTGSNDLYLATGDFVLTFNAANFTSPTVTRGLASTYNLLSTDATQVGGNYRSASSASIAGGTITINLNLISFGDQVDFDHNVAKITNAASTFRFGTYAVSGMTNHLGTLGLQWKTAGGGTVTRVFTYANATPWASSQVTANAVNPTDAPLPITLASFSCTAPATGDVTLKWTTVSETGNYGFEVQRSANPTSGFATLAGSFQKGQGTTSEKHDYAYTDGTAAGRGYYYRLRQIDLDGTDHFSDVISINGATGVASGSALPTEFALHQNYPNPFNPSTTFEFALPKASHVTIELYNLLGQKVATLLDDIRPAGVHQLPFSATSLSSGMYIYRMVAADKTFMRKLTLLK